ncbi:MAG: transglutaminase domain-containing protein [Deltaproteobacteria bacterium]|nr:transglutaminase domain-containing protein [Deltaproteobacteria bacterium]
MKTYRTVVGLVLELGLALLFAAACGVSEDTADDTGGNGAADVGFIDASGNPDGGSPADAGPDAGTVPDASGTDTGTDDAGGDTGSDGGTSDPRQPLRDRSLFSNVSFEEKNTDGSPAGWACKYFGRGAPPEPPCTVKNGGAVHGDRYLELGPEVAVFADEKAFNGQMHVRFDLFMRRETGVSVGDAYLFGEKGADLGWTLYGRTSEPAEGGWTHVRSQSAPLAGIESLRFVVYNSSPDRPLAVDDLVVVEDAQAMVVPGHLLRAEHYGEFACSAGDAPAVIWVPLPMDHGVQVPLYVSLAATPPEAVQKVEYTLDGIGNFGALVTIEAGAEFSNGALHWDGVVFTREATEADLAALYAAESDPAAWLADTPVVHWSHAALKAAVEAVVAGLSDPKEKMSAILGWTSAYVTNEGQLEALDAVSVFETKNASCTGYANLGAAAGRVAGVPARSVANYMVGMTQQTHYINEFWLGDGVGWRLVEPQGTLTALPADYAVVVRADLVTDEGLDAMDPNYVWAMPGVPLHSLVHAVEGHDRCGPVFAASGYFPECPLCDNKAVYQAGLAGDGAKVVSLFDRARVLWKGTLAAFTSTGPNPAEQDLRKASLDAMTIADVEAVITALEGR